MISLQNTSALKLTQLAQLPEEAFIHLLVLQKSISLAEAVTSPTVAQVIRRSGEPVVTKLICAILKLFNDGLNTTLQMGSRQLFEYAQIWLDAFPNETVKDLILCLKRVKAGRYGPIYNRVDGTVVSDFFRQYLLEKAEFMEDYRKRVSQAAAKQTPPALALLSDEQQQTVVRLIRKGKALKTPALDLGPLSSDRTHMDFLYQNAEAIPFDDLVSIKKRAELYDQHEQRDFAKAEIERRATQLDQDYQDYANGTHHP